MRRVFLTVGPQSSGKSTFCRQVAATRPDVILVSRDEILIEMYGSVWLSPYTGQHEVGEMRMWEVIAEHLKRESVTVILDCWNGFVRDRSEITTKLRALGAEHVEAWHFVTPEEAAMEWRLIREPPTPGSAPELAEMRRRSLIDNFRHDYRLFHQQPVAVDQGFTTIRKINPLEVSPATLRF